MDQKQIEYTLQATKGIKSMRATFKELREAKIDENHVLTFRGKEVGFVYYRNGYQAE